MTMPQVSWQKITRREFVHGITLFPKVVSCAGKAPGVKCLSPTITKTEDSHYDGFIRYILEHVLCCTT